MVIAVRPTVSQGILVSVSCLSHLYPGDLEWLPSL